LGPVDGARACAAAAGLAGVGEVAAMGARASGHSGRSVIGWIERDAGLPFGLGGGGPWEIYGLLASPAKWALS